MAQVMRVSLPTYNALTDTDPRHYSLFSDQDNVLIKELARGSESVADGATETIAHSLGYQPHFFGYTEVSSGRYKLTNGYNLFGEFRAWVDGTNLYYRNNAGATRILKYFIFYDNID